MGVTLPPTPVPALPSQTNGRGKPCGISRPRFPNDGGSVVAPAERGNLENRKAMILQRSRRERRQPGCAQKDGGYHAETHQVPARAIADEHRKVPFCLLTQEQSPLRCDSVRRGSFPSRGDPGYKSSIAELLRRSN
jgi:hypothetical protein